MKQFDFADAFRRLKTRRGWTDEDVAHALSALGLDVQPETVRSWTYAKRSPGDIVKPLLRTFLSTQLEVPMTEEMPQLYSLSVTDGVIQQSANAPDQRQIKITPFDNWASYRSGRIVALDFGSFALMQGDNYGIWGVHNNGNDAFDHVFNLLSLAPDKPTQVRGISRKTTIQE